MKTSYFPDRIGGCRSCLRVGCLIYYRDIEMVKSCPCYYCLVKSMCHNVCEERSQFFNKILNEKFIQPLSFESSSEKNENENTL